MMLGTQRAPVHLHAHLVEQLCDNAGFDSNDILSALRKKHAQDEDGKWYGVDIERGEYGFSSLLKQNKKGKNCAVFCFAGKRKILFYILRCDCEAKKLKTGHYSVVICIDMYRYVCTCITLNLEQSVGDAKGF